MSRAEACPHGDTGAEPRPVDGATPSAGRGSSAMAGRGDPPAALSYDGSFAGFLCAAAEALNAARSGFPLPPIRGPAGGDELFDESVSVPRDAGRAAALWKRLRARAGADAARTCLEAFCSDVKGRERFIAAALARVFREGRRALDDLGDPDICGLAAASRRACAQAHLLSGLVRFSELADGSWYAPIEPDCDVLPLVAEHFAARYADMAFALHDRRRGAALLHSPGAGWRIVEGFSAGYAGGAAAGAGEGPGAELPLSEGEKDIQSGWREYFEATGIAQRKNPRLQASRMPKKYWPFLPEMRGPGPRR